MGKKFLFFSLVVLIVACKKTTNKEKGNFNSHIHISKNEGKKWNVFGVKIIGKVLSEQTQGAYSVITTETPPNGGPPLHVHSHEDELFYVLKGTYTFTCGNEKINAKEGDFIRLPRGVPHNFVNTDTITGITINTITPGGFEHFFDEIALISKNKKPSRQEIDAIAHKFGMKFIKK